MKEEVAGKDSMAVVDCILHMRLVEVRIVGCMDLRDGPCRSFLRLLRLWDCSLVLDLLHRDLLLVRDMDSLSRMGGAAFALGRSSPLGWRSMSCLGGLRACGHSTGRPRRALSADLGACLLTPISPSLLDIHNQNGNMGRPTMLTHSLTVRPRQLRS